MDNKKLNEHILHYLENDKTNSAIMLTAPWGTGKSYYIKNELVPFLYKDEKNRCIIVSLYGLNEISEISKSIYLESRIKFLNKKSEKVTVGKIIAKTVVKGVSSFFGVDLNASEKDLNQLYESVNLKDKLLIFEDIERSGVDLIEFLGYVNSLVEQDGVKVLLVANEEEIIKYEERETKTAEEEKTAEFIDKYTENEHRKYTDKTKQYLKIKEKTISDTIEFKGDFYAAVKNIISSYENDILNKFVDDKSLEEIVDILGCHGYNLRSFLFACQKTVDLYKYVDSSLDEDFIKSIFYGNLIFSLKIKKEGKIKWEGDKYLSVSLGSKDYPLYHFCFNYIINQSFDEAEIKKAENSFKELRLYDESKSSGDKDLHVIYSYYTSPEKKVVDAVKNIAKRLKNEDDIAFQEYGRLANYLISISEVLDIDISDCKEYLIKNLSGRSDKLNDYLLFCSEIALNNKDKLEEFEQLKEAMLKSLNSNNTNIFGFDYDVKHLNEFCNTVYEKRAFILNNKEFAKNINVEKFIRLIYQCSAEQLYVLRHIFHTVYSFSNINDYFSVDKPVIYEILKALQEINKDKFDKIQLMQLNYFINDLKKITDRLQK